MSKETCPKCKREGLETRPNGSVYCLYAIDCAYFGPKPKTLEDELHEELLYQWVSNHSAVCRLEWPHYEECYWRAPSILMDYIAEIGWSSD